MDNDFLEQISVAKLPKCKFSDIEHESEKLFNEDVIDESTFNDWTIDDFIGSLPETIEYKYDSLAGFKLYYNVELDEPCWIAGYSTSWDDLIYESDGETPYEALKTLYIKINNINNE